MKSRSSRESRKNLPQTIEAEKSLLGSILLNNEVLTTVGDMVADDDFLLESNRRIFMAMKEMSDKHVPIDSLTLSDYLEKKDWGQITGAPDNIYELAEIVPTAANAVHYARLIVEKGIFRKLILASEEIAQKGYDGTLDTDEVLDYAERKIMDVGARRSRSEFVQIGDLSYLDTQFKHLEELKNREIKELVTGLPTGFVDLDHMTTGFHPSELIIVAGRPAMGKTAFVLSIAQHIAFDQKKPVGIFSLEMPKEQLFLRLISSQARVNQKNLRTGHLTSEEWEHVMQAFGEASDVPIYIDDSGDLTIFELRTRARRLKKQRKDLSMIAVDYLQLVRGSQRTDNREQEISEISRSLKALAKELQIPVIALAQLSRAVENRPGSKKPTLSDLRESGAIEQDADIVLFIYRDEVYHPDNIDSRGKAEIVIGKQRNGPIGSAMLAYQGFCTRFENLAVGYDDISSDGFG
ncbi:MAG: replicative DNA helicase [Leptospirillia bacterium]